MALTVFYAWQSDRNEKHCRFLIRDVAKAAVKKIARDATVKEAPSLDHDTKDEPGTPHIADTILRKIKRCGIFLADVTSVADYATNDDRPKQTPNPNVMVELGLAIRSVGWSRIVLVMNTAYGPADNLPFDLRHHSFPIQYHLPHDAENVKDVKAGLLNQLEAKLRTTIRAVEEKLEKAHLTKNREQEAEGESLAEARWREFCRLVDDNQFRNIAPGPHLCVGLFPLRSQAQKINLRNINQDRELLEVIQPMGASSFNRETFGRAIVARTPNGTPRTVAEFNDDGCILAARVMPIRENVTHGKGVAFQVYEHEMFIVLGGYVRAMRKFGIVGPVGIRIRVSGVAGVKLMPTGNLDGARPMADDVYELDAVVLHESVDGKSGLAIASAAHEPMNVLWREAGQPRGDPSFTSDGTFQSRFLS